MTWTNIPKINRKIRKTPSEGPLNNPISTWLFVLTETHSAVGGWREWKGDRRGKASRTCVCLQREDWLTSTPRSSVCAESTGREGYYRIKWAYNSSRLDRWTNSKELSKLWPSCSLFAPVDYFESLFILSARLFALPTINSTVYGQWLFLRSTVPLFSCPRTDSILGNWLKRSKIQ